MKENIDHQRRFGLVDPKRDGSHLVQRSRYNERLSRLGLTPQSLVDGFVMNRGGQVKGAPMKRSLRTHDRRLSRNTWRGSLSNSEYKLLRRHTRKWKREHVFIVERRRRWIVGWLNYFEARRSNSREREALMKQEQEAGTIYRDTRLHRVQSRASKTKGLRNMKGLGATVMIHKYLVEQGKQVENLTLNNRKMLNYNRQVIERCNQNRKGLKLQWALCERLKKAAIPRALPSTANQDVKPLQPKKVKPKAFQSIDLEFGKKVRANRVTLTEEEAYLAESYKISGREKMWDRILRLNKVPKPKRSSVMPGLWIKQLKKTTNSDSLKTYQAQVSRFQGEKGWEKTWNLGGYTRHAMSLQGSDVRRTHAKRELEQSRTIINTANHMKMEPLVTWREVPWWFSL